MVYTVRGAIPIIPAKIQQLKADEDKPLPAPHATLPVKPAWAVIPDGVDEEGANSSVKALTGATIPSISQPRRLWRIESNTSTTLEEALRGTAILEWPRIEIWKKETVEQEVRNGSVELIERREFDPVRSKKRKLEREEEGLQDEPGQTQIAFDQGSESSEVEEEEANA